MELSYHQRSIVMTALLDKAKDYDAQARRLSLQGYHNAASGCEAAAVECREMATRFDPKADRK